MEIDGAADELGEVHAQVFDVLTPRLPQGVRLGSLERLAFYARGKTTFAVVQCGETRPFGCFILRKGVIF